MDIVNLVYEKVLFFIMIKNFMDKGLDMFICDENGYSLWDWIFFKYYRVSKEIMREKLVFVDEFLINIVIGGDKDFFLGLVLDSYDFDVIEDRKGWFLL